MGDPRDIALRSDALEYVRELQRRYDDLVPVRALAEGFQFRGRRVSFGSFYSGIFRPKELKGPAALLPGLYADFIRRKALPSGQISEPPKNGPDVARFSTQPRCGPVSRARSRAADGDHESR